MTDQSRLNAALSLAQHGERTQQDVKNVLGGLSMERMERNLLRERVAEAVEAALLRTLRNDDVTAPARLHVAATDAALTALGLDDRLLAAIADSRYSDEWVGNAIRVAFSRSATGESENG